MKRLFILIIFYLLLFTLPACTPEEPQPSPTSQPVATAVPTITPSSADPLTQAVETIIHNLNSHAFDGYPLAETFFYGTYGVRTDIVDANQLPFAVATRYAGDTYGVRPLSLTADVDAPLPNGISQEEALALNPTQHEISAIVPSSGWGVDQPAQALLYFTEEDGQPLWVGAIFSFDSFAEQPDYPTIPLTDEMQRFLQAEDSFPLQQELAARYDSFFYQFTINPSGTIALHTPNMHEFGVYTYELIDLNSGDVTTLESENGINISANDAIWLDDKRVLLSYRDSIDDEGPVWGHLGLLDITTNSLTPIEDEVLLAQPPVQTPNGTLIYNNHQGDAILWKDGRKETVSLAPILASSNSAWLSASALSISNDLRYIIGVTSINEPEISRSQGIYVLLDRETEETTILTRFDAPPMGGYTDPAIWNDVGSHAVISPWANFAEQQGLTVVNAATAESIFLGLETSNGRWLSDDQLLFNAIINNERQLHLLDVTTGERVRIEFNPNALYWPGTDQPNMRQWQTAVSQNLGFSLLVPIGWRIEEQPEGFYAFSDQFWGDGPHQTSYYLFANELPNPDNLPLDELYTNQFDPNTREEFAASLSEVTVNGRSALRSDFIFSANGGLGLFVEDEKRYLQISLFPYSSEQPYEQQARYVQIFETAMDHLMVLDTDTDEIGSNVDQPSYMLAYTNNNLVRVGMDGTVQPISQPLGSLGENLWMSFANNVAQVSPDGRYLLLSISSSASSGSWQVVEVATGAIIAEGAGQSRISPTWSPDSQRLAYFNDGNVCIFDIRNQTELCTGVAPDLLFQAWSPSSNHIAVVERNIGGPGFGVRIWLLDVNKRVAQDLGVVSTAPHGPAEAIFEWVGGDDPTLVLKSTSAEIPSRLYEVMSGETVEITEPVRDVSPNGRFIIHYSGDVTNREGQLLFTLPTNDTCPHAPFSIHNWDWSPDSSQLAFLLFCHEERERAWLSVLDAETGTVQWEQQLELTSDLQIVHWTPDGAYLLLDSLDGDAGQGFSPIWRVAVDGRSAPEPIIDRAHLIDVIPAWSTNP